MRLGLSLGNRLHALTAHDTLLCNRAVAAVSIADEDRPTCGNCRKLTAPDIADKREDARERDLERRRARQRAWRARLAPHVQDAMRRRDTELARARRAKEQP